MMGSAGNKWRVRNYNIASHMMGTIKNTCKSLTVSAKSAASNLSRKELHVKRVTDQKLSQHTKPSHIHYHSTTHVEKKVESVSVGK